MTFKPRYPVPARLDAHPIRTGVDALDARVFVYALDADGALVFGWPASAEQAEEWLAGAERNEDRAATERVEAALAAWEAGDFSALDSLAVAAEGSEFQQEMWAAMREVPAGELIAYGELATRAGRSDAARAAGSACGANPVLLVVPCHRFVPAGSLEGLREGRGDVVGNYAAGPEVKAALLEFEGALG